MDNMNYALITPAKNEEDHIEKTLASVTAQSILPRRWVIVSDGSTDRTDQIVARYAKRHDFIRLLRRESGSYCFGSKVHAIRAGYSELHDLSFDFIGNLDADIELPANYYERLLHHFAEDARLGLTGGAQHDLRNGKFVRVRFNELNIGGAYQLFRRTCYEDIEGYMPLEMGGEDTIAGIMARHRGWRVQAFPDIKVLHYRPAGASQGNLIRVGFRNGKRNFLMGYHPLFEIVRLMRVERPTQILHNVSELVGFTTSAARGFKRQVSQDVVDYLRAEQLSRLKHTFLRGHDPASGTRT